MSPPPPRSTLFPYTTLFRSQLTVLPAVRASGWSDPGRGQPNLLVYDEADPKKGGLFQEASRSEEQTSELQSHSDLVCRLLLVKPRTISRLTSHRFCLCRFFS